MVEFNIDGSRICILLGNKCCCDEIYFILYILLHRIYSSNQKYQEFQGPVRPLRNRSFSLMVWKCYNLKSNGIKMFIWGKHVLRSYWQWLIKWFNIVFKHHLLKYFQKFLLLWDLIGRFLIITSDSFSFVGINY